MTVRELIAELIEHDMDHQVYLVNDNDLMRPTDIKDVRVMEYYSATPAKLDECRFPAMDNTIFANAVLLRWT